MEGMLILAIENRNYPLICFLIENNVPEINTNSGMTPIMYAVKYKQPELAKEFILKGHDIFALDSDGNDVLVYAIEVNKNYEFIEYLIENGFSPNRLYSDDWSALDIAIYANNLLPIFILLNLGGNFIKSRNFGLNSLKLGNSLLIEYFKSKDCRIQEPGSDFPKESSKSLEEKMSLCVIHNRLDLLKSLISDYNYTLVNEKGNNILSQSIESYQMEIFDFIIKNLNWKEMMKVKNNEGLLPIHMALQRANYYVIRTFCQLSETCVKIDHLCFLKTRIHKGLFDYLKQWNLFKTTKNSDISFQFQ
jgi:ankyrin repeat protein